MEPGPVTQILSDEYNWVKSALAFTNDDKCVPPSSPKAVKFSIRGAIMKCYPNDHPRKLAEFMEVANKHYPNYSYEQLSLALSHKALMFILKETTL